jgi:hypothetical protein
MNATVRRCMTFLMSSACAIAAHANGLQINPDTTWPRWQARLGITTAPQDSSAQPRTTLEGAGLLGDYYFTGPGFAKGIITGGFRATSGLFTGTRSTAIATPVLPSREGSSFTLNSRARMAPDASNDAAGAVPYLGIGYTGLSLRGGWGFSADVGLVGSGVRLGRANSGTQADELLRELRLTPMLQLGVSYSF